MFIGETRDRSFQSSEKVDEEGEAVIMKPRRDHIDGEVEVNLRRANEAQDPPPLLRMVNPPVEPELGMGDPELADIPEVGMEPGAPWARMGRYMPEYRRDINMNIPGFQLNVPVPEAMELETPPASPQFEGNVFEVGEKFIFSFSYFLFKV